MVRDRIEELLSIKQRAGKYKRVPSHHDLIALKESWERNAKEGDPISELVPIRIITMLEVFLRHWIETLIDHGAPYVERASKLSANIRYDFAIARSLQGGSVSLGALIAHSLSLSQLESVASTFNTILDSDLFVSLANVRDRWEVKQAGEDVVPIIEDVREVRRTLARTFEVRNILVHEMPETPPHSTDEVSHFLAVASQFLHAAQEHFLSLVYGDYPLTQMEMNQDAASKHAGATDELEALCNVIERESESKEIHEVQRAWLAFKEAEAGRQTQWHLGGSIRPMIYSTVAAQLTNDRIRQLKYAQENQMD
jgi:uncharacterized protein YecT (DUF1311 family)